MNEQKNLLLAIVVSLIILLIFQYLFPTEKQMIEEVSEKYERSVPNPPKIDPKRLKRKQEEDGVKVAFPRRSGRSQDAESTPIRSEPSANLEPTMDQKRKNAK